MKSKELKDIFSDIKKQLTQAHRYLDIAKLNLQVYPNYSGILKSINGKFVFKRSIINDLFLLFFVFVGAFIIVVCAYSWGITWIILFPIIVGVPFIIFGIKGLHFTKRIIDPFNKLIIIGDKTILVDEISFIQLFEYYDEGEIFQLNLVLKKDYERINILSSNSLTQIKNCAKLICETFDLPITYYNRS